MDDANKTAIESFKAEHATALKRMEEQNKAAIEDLEAEHAKAIKTLKQQNQTAADAAKATYEAALRAEQEEKEKAQRATDAANQTTIRLRDQLRRVRAIKDALFTEVTGVTLPDVVSDRSRQVQGLVTRSGGTVLRPRTSDGNDGENWADELKQNELEHDAVKQEQEQDQDVIPGRIS